MPSRSFLGQCPLTLLAMILTWFLMPDHSVILDDRSTRDKLLRVDFLGAVMLASTILAFLLPLELGGQALPWSHPLIFGLFAIFVALGLMFLYIEAYWAKEPILSIHILKSRNVLVPNIVQFSQMAAQLGVCQATGSSSRNCCRSNAFLDDVYSSYIFSNYAKRNNNRCWSSSVSSCCRKCYWRPLRWLYDEKVWEYDRHIIDDCSMQCLSVFRTGRYKKLVVFATVCASICYTLLIVRWNSRINIWESLYIIPG